MEWNGIGGGGRGGEGNEERLASERHAPCTLAQSDAPALGTYCVGDNGEARCMRVRMQGAGWRRQLHCMQCVGLHAGCMVPTFRGLQQGHVLRFSMHACTAHEASKPACS